MRRRLLVAKALVHSPPVVVLDEPTAGVDVELRQSLWEYMKTLNDAGTTILLHPLPRRGAEMCDEIAIINHGEIVRIHIGAAGAARPQRGPHHRRPRPKRLARRAVGPGVDAAIENGREIWSFPPSQVQMGACSMR